MSNTSAPAQTFDGSVNIGGVAGYVIGRRGATIRDIQRNCHVRISIDDSKVGNEIAQISGRNKTDVDAAVAKIQEAVNQAKAAPARPAPTFSTRIDVTAGQAAAVIGVKGETIQRIRSTSGASVKIVSRHRQESVIIEADNEGSGKAAETAVREAITTATERAVPETSRPPRSGRGGRGGRGGRRGGRRAPRDTNARESRAPRMTREEHEASIDKSHSTVVTLKDAGLTIVVVGPRGSTVRSIQEVTGTVIDVDRESGKVTVSGPNAEAVKAGAEKVVELIRGYKKCASGGDCLGYAGPDSTICQRCQRLANVGSNTGASNTRDDRRRGRGRVNTRGRSRTTKEAVNQGRA